MFIGPMRRKLGYSYPCMICGVKFVMGERNQKMCSKECRIIRINGLERHYYSRDIVKEVERYKKYYAKNKEKVSQRRKILRDAKKMKKIEQ